MKTQLVRLAIAATVSLGLAAAAIGSAAASTPAQYHWTNEAYDPGYFDCGGHPIDGDWTVTHDLTFYIDAAGTPTSDREKIDFTGRFVDPATGLSIADSGQSIFFDTLAPDGSYLTTVMNSVRHSDYFHAAGRTDFQSGAHVGVDRWDSGLAAACAALGY